MIFFKHKVNIFYSQLFLKDIFCAKKGNYLGKLAMMSVNAASLRLVVMTE
jgi:hypothetical protein